MYARESIKIEGAKEIENALGQLGSKLSAKIIRSSLKTGGNILHKAVDEETPVMTGLLRSQQRITMRRGKAGKLPYAEVSIKNNPLFSKKTLTGKRRQKTRKGDVRYVKGSYFYPAAVFYGHDSVEGNRWMQRGVDKSWVRATGAVMRELKNKIEKKFASIARAGRKFMKDVAI